MDFTFSEDQQLFRDNIKAFLSEQITPEGIRKSWETGTGRSPELWKQLVDLGLTGMLVPEKFGGLGMTELDFVLIAQECGRVALPEPLVDTVMVASPMLAALAPDDARCASLLEKIAAGTCIVGVSHTVNPVVADAHVADYLLLPSGNQLHLVGRDQVKLIAQESVDPSRRLFAVDWTPSAETCLGNGAVGVSLLASLLNRGALGAAAQMIGLAEAMVAQTVKYTADRKQFGMAIGANQALKHHMADCAVKIEFAKPVVYRAAYTVSRQPVYADYVVSHAKVAAGEAAHLAARHAIQCFGAMGYTWECDLHIWMKRAWALDKFWGHSGFHKNRLHEWLLNPNAKIGADKTFGEQA
jgi:alkylation response protein AidB-like acyl-CoA dehydrogenase